MIKANGRENEREEEENRETRFVRHSRGDIVAPNRKKYASSKGSE